MSVEHHLKTKAEYWDAIKRGDKNFEVRRDDRGFQKGDILVLKRLAHEASYQNCEDTRAKPLRREITYILTGGQFGVEPGYVVMSLGEIQ